MRPRRPEKLHAGRHGLSPEAVIAHQRARMLNAVGGEVAVRGFAATTVQDIITSAGVSRRTFYDQFPGKEAIYLAALEAFESELRTAVQGAVSHREPLDERVAEVLGVILAFLAARPTSTRAFFVEVAAAGPRARAHHDSAVADLVAGLDAAAGRDPRRRRPDGPGRVAAALVIGGVYQIIVGRVLAGESEDLPGLHSDLVDAVLAMYQWPDDARQVSSGVRRPPAPRLTPLSRSRKPL